MNPESVKAFTKELAVKLKSNLEDPKTARFIEKLATTSQDALVHFEVVMSTDDEDRQGDELDQKLWNFEYFDLNPVVLWAHDYESMPVGMVTGHTIKGSQTIVTGVFAPSEIYEWAGTCAGMYKAKFLNAVSPGYLLDEKGNRELLEVSFCPVPAGRFAISTQEMRALKTNTRELVTKGFSFMEKEVTPIAKTPQIGDTCELTDGSPGVLATDDDNPGTLVCVPAAGGKTIKNNNTTMKDELDKKLKAEHGRHGKAIAKAIDEFDEKCMKCVKAQDDEEEKKAHGADHAEHLDKAVDEFTKAVDAEHVDHKEACLKAVDETYEDFGKEDGGTKAVKAKDIEEFKSEVGDEHEKHVKAFTKAIDEYTKAVDGDPEKHEKAMEEFTQKSADELDRHEKAHEDMTEKAFGEGEDDGKAEKKLGKCKSCAAAGPVGTKHENCPKHKGMVEDIFMEDAEQREKNERVSYVMQVMYAFCEAFYYADVTDFFELLEEAIELIEAYASHEKTGETDAEEQAEGQSQKSAPRILAKLKEIRKSGRTISNATKDKLDGVIKALEEHKTKAEEDHKAHLDHTDDVIAAVKAITPEGDEGDDDGKKAVTPKQRPSTAGPAPRQKGKASEEFDALLFAQRLLRQIKTGTDDALRQINSSIGDKR